MPAKRRHNRMTGTMSEDRQAEQTEQPESLWASARQILLWVILVVAVRSLLVEPFNIPSASMIPTLQVGDFVAVSKMSYGYSRYSFPFSPSFIPGRFFAAMPHRGDVAVFRFTKDTSVDYIKRIVGLPGDRIRMEQGRLFINGREVPRNDQGPYSVVDERGYVLSGTRYREMLPREDGKTVAHDILKMRDDDLANNTPEYTVPEGCLFAMGDDRDDSSDSRFQGGHESGACAVPAGNDYLTDSGGHDLGFVPVNNLVGRAKIILFSVDMRHPAWQFWYWPTEIRWGRFLHGVD